MKKIPKFKNEDEERKFQPGARSLSKGQPER